MRNAHVYKLTTLVTIGIAAFAVLAFMTAIGISDTSVQERADIVASLE